MGKRECIKALIIAIGIVIWIFLLSVTTVVVLDDFSVVVKLIFSVIIVLYTVLGWILFSRNIDKLEKQVLEANEKELQELLIKYKYYVELVDKHVRLTLDKLKDETLNIEVDNSFKYLISFANNIDFMLKYRIAGKPDSFIIASCLMYSLIDHPVIKVVDDSLNYVSLKPIRFSFNMDAVMGCIFEIISEPSTYFEENGIWLEQKHPKVNINVPKGIIKDDDLYKRILNNIYTDEVAGNRASIMQFSNLLHLIYLNCK